VWKRHSLSCHVRRRCRVCEARPHDGEDKGGGSRDQPLREARSCRYGQASVCRPAIPALGPASVHRKYARSGGFCVNTGVPHAVIFDDQVDDDVHDLAVKIRFDPVFPLGANVDFVKVDGNTLAVRTYERGVERETLSCGTVLSQPQLSRTRWASRHSGHCQTLGGPLKVTLRKDRALMEGRRKRSTRASIS